MQDKSYMMVLYVTLFLPRYLGRQLVALFFWAPQSAFGDLALERQLHQIFA